ncbi:MAG: glycosyltransferase, partial [Flavisolibacter sp.]
MLFCDILRNKTIFIAPLDWGLGHATRCVPLIKQLMENNVVILGITPTTALIFNEEFPELKKIDIEPYHISYSKRLPIGLKLLFETPRILGVIRKEHEQLKTIIKEQQIDVAISDNRFGLYHKDVECIYMTHQLNIQAGLFSSIATKIHQRYINKFDQVWIPDYENKSLAGNLSKNKGLKNVTYIGPISRLPISESFSETFDYLCLLSGPEPLRSELESQLIEQAGKSVMKICLVRGSTKALSNIPQNMTVSNLPTAAELGHLIQSSKTIICRSGYSTLMD